MYKISVSCVCLMAFMLVGCSSFSVYTDYDDSADFSQYNTFRWMQRKGAKMDHKGIMSSKIRRNVRDELEARGMQYSEKRPDLLIVYHFGVRDKVDVDVYGYGYRRGWKRQIVHHYKEGTLVLDFVDAGRNELVWRGWASGVVGPPADAQAKVPEAVRSILKNYPPSH